MENVAADETKRNSLTLAIEETSCVRYECLTCGHATEKDPFQVMAREGGERFPGRGGAICADCLASGDIVARVKERAREMRESADELESLVIDGPIPTLADLTAARDRYDAEILAARGTVRLCDQCGEERDPGCFFACSNTPELKAARAARGFDPDEDVHF